MWTKLSDTFYDHPKICAVGNEGAGLFARLLSYSSKFLTEGIIKESCTLLKGEERVIALLTEHGMLKRIAGGYSIHGYLEYNLSKKDLAQKSEAAKIANAVRWKGNKPKVQPAPEPKPTILAFSANYPNGRPI